MRKRKKKAIGSTEMTLLIVLFLLVELWETDAISATGVVGDKTTIKCSHSNAYSNVKYFCKATCDNEDILVTSRETNKDSNGKYSIENNGNTFTVTISDLTKDDSGTYWCGIERFGLDTYNEVVLTVTEEDTKGHDSIHRKSDLDETINTNSLSSEKLVYIGAGLGVVLLVLAMVLLIFFRHRKRHISASSGMHPDRVNATPCFQKQDAQHDTTSYSANEDQQTDGSIDSIVSSASNQHRNTSRDNIYSNITVSSEPQIQPEDLFYSTISFNGHTDISTVTPRTATATYSTLKHTWTDESTDDCSMKKLQSILEGRSVRTTPPIHRGSSSRDSNCCIKTVENCTNCPTETMRITLKVFVCLMTVSVSLLPVMESKRGSVNKNCENTAVTFTAYRGGSVTVNCTYPRAEASSVKLFYRDTTSLISSFQSQHTKRDRFSLTDDRQQGVYTVIISSLNESDAGKYWCAMEGVNDNSTTCLTEILLRILNWEDIKPLKISEHLLQSVQITCPYPKSHEGNEKFLCKGENPLNCEELIQTTKEDNANKGRFSIRDNQRLAYFYVYINHLTEADSGTYWCGSGRTMQHDEYTKIHLSVVAKGPKTKTLDPPGQQTTTTEPGLTTIKHRLGQNDDKDPVSPSNKYDLNRIVGVGLCLVLLVALSVVVLIVYRRKCLKAQGGSPKPRTNAVHHSEKNNEDHNYEEIQLQNQAESSPTTVYATVSLPADLLHYSSVTFHKNGNSPSDTDINGTALDATHPPAAEQTLYSTVRKSDEEQ
ncbi:uncharacterized protein LOC103362244 [Stegastes partitus]|uniref:Uncharacterized protein LOC103362244 n=2 Tax=Stegastes partitus TaxID=144197 RepID=A0A9Y4MY94_9TELE|nr:PREDICTED: uncharacterized protein LOC103362244 [Stegastes partitus]